MAVRKKNPIFFLLVILIFAAIIGVGGYSWYQSYESSPVDKNAKIEIFVIKPGETPTDVAIRLQEEGVIRSSKVFLKEFKKQENQVIQPGDFKLSAAMTPQEVIEKLLAGSVDNRLTLLEGWRVEQMAQKIEKEMGILQQDFLAAAKEGYMFPDTYFFNPDATVATIVGTMEGNFDKKYDVELKQKVKALGLTETQGVVLASLVEREGRSDKVRQEVASIMLKRLKMGMKLDIDATVRYAIDTQSYRANPALDKWWGAITQDDYSGVKSPYNTYLNNSLPPAPICNPSLSSLKAVASADASTPYLYYYHDLQGNSYYARTLEEHIQNHVNHP